MAQRNNEGLIERFRQATAAALRAVAGAPELTVAFSAEPAVLRGTEALLPQPARDLPPGEVAIVRGEAPAQDPGPVLEVVKMIELGRRTA